MKFRPMLDTLERREVPSVVTPDDPNAPPPYTPLADTGTLPGNPGTQPGDTGMEPGEPGDKPVTPDDKKALSKTQAEAERVILVARMQAIAKETARLETELERFTKEQNKHKIALDAAKQVVAPYQQAFDQADSALKQYLQENPNWKDHQPKVRYVEELTATKNAAEHDLNIAKKVLQPLLDQAKYIQQRIDAIVLGILALKEELKLVKLRHSDIVGFLDGGAMVYEAPPIPKAVLPTIDDVFNDWSKPLVATDLKAQPPK